MSNRSDVRYAVAKWIADAGIPNLNQVFAAPPKRINFQQNASPGQLLRVAGQVFIARERESRVALGGANDGWKRIDYDVQFELFAHCSHPLSTDAQDDLDLVVDAVTARLRSGGHRLGYADGNTIWQAAEPGIEIEFGEPLTNEGGMIELWSMLTFQVTQMIRS